VKKLIQVMFIKVCVYCNSHFFIQGFHQSKFDVIGKLTQNVKMLYQMKMSHDKLSFRTLFLTPGAFE
jgi:hypothetical protein